MGNVKYSIELPSAPSESNALFEQLFSVLDAVEDGTRLNRSAAKVILMVKTEFR